jgi:hypothetical protein
MDIGATIGVARRVAHDWERLALETEHNAPQVPNLCCAINFDGSYSRRAISSRMGSEKVAGVGHRFWHRKPLN